jgi:hypothetical protein
MRGRLRGKNMPKKSKELSALSVAKLKRLVDTT